jgi:hypothetical protein
MTLTMWAAGLAVLGLTGSALADCGGCGGGMCPKASGQMEAVQAAEMGEVASVEAAPAGKEGSAACPMAAATDKEGSAACPMAAATGKEAGAACPMATAEPCRADKGMKGACGMCRTRAAAQEHRVMHARKQVDAALAALKKGDREAAMAALTKAQSILAPPEPIAKPAEAGVVNTRCPVMGGKLDRANVPDALTVEFRGQKVGFCCAGCPAAWAKLPDAEKAAKLEAATEDTQ